MMKKSTVGVVSVALLFGGSALARDFDDIVQAARGQTVYFNAWGGSDVINDYIAWAIGESKAVYYIDVEHVRITDTAQVVARILAEQQAEVTQEGSVDLIWVNGENFGTLKREGLLHAPWTQWLPNYAYVDTVNKPSTLMDFGVPVDHQEAPWGMAQLTFFYDTDFTETPPRSMSALLDYARENPGRVTYPNPPNFHGTTFIKQALYELIETPELLQEPVEPQRFDELSAPLWAFLDSLHPLMWRQGQNFPRDSGVMVQLLNDGEIDIGLTFNPNEPANAIAEGLLPRTVRSYMHSSGTVGNTHFLAIPANAEAPEAAMVFANFLLSPRAQALKADPAVWGDPTVLDVGGLPEQEQMLFVEAYRMPGVLAAEDYQPVLLEPHVSWVTALEEAWMERYQG